MRAFCTPRLFDLLAHRALNYFKAGEFELVKPSYNFQIDDSLAFAPLRNS